MTRPIALQKAAAAHVAWREGQLDYKLFKYQVPIHEKVEALVADGAMEIVLLIGRQFGKTTELLLLGAEKALAGYRDPDGNVRPANVAYLTKTKKSAQAIAKDKFEDFCADAPRTHKFEFASREEQWVCKKNGSKIVFIGCERDSVNLHRGKTWDLILVDEAAFIDEVDDYIKDVFGPGTVIRSAPIIYGTTLPEKPKAQFFTILRRCRALGHTVEWSIYDEPCYLNPRQYRDAAQKAGGETSVTFRREYGNEELYETNDLVIPEWPLVAKELTVAQKIPRWAIKYEAIDLGFRDLSICLFGYVDFFKQTIHIQAEHAARGTQGLTAPFATEVKKKQKLLWGDNPDFSGRVVRISDIDPRFLAELRINHGLDFAQIQRGNQGGKAAMISRLRFLFQNKQITVDPSCVVLLETLYTAMYKNESRVDFARDADIGHADALDALIYLAWIADLKMNPIPAGSDPYNPWQTISPRPDPREEQWVDVFKKKKKF